MWGKEHNFRRDFSCAAILFVLLACFHGSLAQPITILPKLPDYKTSKEFTLNENDSTIYEIKLTFSEGGLPLYFFRNVFTLVCFTEVCKPVYIDLYWDLLGNYIGFQVPDHEPLTKTDHKEFEEEDYKQLHEILSNTQSILQDFSIYDLVDSRTYKLSDSVDAVTGATPKTIRDEVIGGAVYTCYTLWHIVNGPVKESIRQITEADSNDELLERFLKSDNHHYQYWAIDKTLIDEETRNEFLPQMLKIVTGKNIFTARYALDKISSETFSMSDTLQSWLWSVYKKSNYTLQSAIIEKLQTISLSDSLELFICKELTNANEEQFVRMLRLLGKTGRLSGNAITELGNHLDNFDSHRAAAIYKILSETRITDVELRKKMKRIEKSNPHLH